MNQKDWGETMIQQYCHKIPAGVHSLLKQNNMQYLYDNYFNLGIYGQTQQDSQDRTDQTLIKNVL